MSNVFTKLIPTLFSAAQEVSAEPFGVVSAINAHFDAKGVAKGDEVTVPIAPTRTATDFVPGATPPQGDDSNDDAVKVKITASKKVSWHLTGEQLASLENADSDKEWLRQQVLQGMRTLRNLAEADAGLAIKVGASRAIGTAGTTPFASDLNGIPQVRKVLKDNGAPMSDLQLVVDSNAELNLLQLGIIQQSQQAGSDEERRSGVLKRQFGFAISTSAGITVHAPGTGASYVANGASALKVRDIALKTGTGTVLAGDIGTFAGDANKYVVNAGIAAPGAINIGRPGLLKAVADGAAFSVGAAYTPNLAFERNAVVGVMRPPKMPPNPTMQMQTISDAKGMTYLLIQIAQYGQVSWELHLAWGFKVVQGEHVALLMG